MKRHETPKRYDVKPQGTTIQSRITQADDGCNTIKDLTGSKSRSGSKMVDGESMKGHYELWDCSGCFPQYPLSSLLDYDVHERLKYTTDTVNIYKTSNLWKGYGIRNMTRNEWGL